MSRLHRAALVLLAALAAPVWAAPVWAAQPPAGLAAAFGALPQQSDVVLSQSGRMLAWQQQGRSGPEVVVYDLRLRVVRRTLRIDPSWKLRWLRWQGDGMLLMGVGVHQSLPFDWQWDTGRKQIPVSLVMAVDIADGRSRELLVDRMVTTGVAAGSEGTIVGLTSAAHLLDWDTGQPHTVIMSTDTWSSADYRSGTGTLIHNAQRDSGFVNTVFSVDTLTGADEPIAHGDAFTDQWVVNAEGRPVARSEWRPSERRYTLYARHGDDWRQIYQRTDGLRPWLLGLDANAQAILASIPGGAGPRRVWEIPLDGSAPKPMLPTVRQGVLSVVFSRYGHRPTEVWVGGPHPHWHWLDTAAKSRYESVARAFPGRMVRVYDHTEDGKAVLAEVQAPGDPPVYYLVNFATHHAMIAGEAYPQLDHVPLGAAHAVQYRTRTGRTVHAQEFLPPGGGKDLPLVALVPGGPVSADPEGFDWLAQYLAASGYAVLQPQMTLTQLASQGGWVMWGGASQRGVVDGVRTLVKQGVADPHRVCIVGVGYGGYAALAGVAFHPGTYACAVSVNGISDLSSLVERAGDVPGGGMGSNHSAVAAWRAAVGSPSDPKVIAESPVHAAKAVVAPVLLIHDEGDRVVPVTQSLEMRRALEKLGKPVTFVKLDGADHWLAKGGTRIEVLKAIGGFLHRYLH